MHNERIDGRVKQHVIVTLGRLDVLRKTSQLDALLTCRRNCSTSRRRIANSAASSPALDGQVVVSITVALMMCREIHRIANRRYVNFSP